MLISYRDHISDEIDCWKLVADSLKLTGKTYNSQISAFVPCPPINFERASKIFVTFLLICYANEISGTLPISHVSLKMAPTS